MTIQEKNELLDKLRALYRYADLCKTVCLEHERMEDAALLSVFAEQVRLASNNLLRGIYRDWVGSTDDLGRWLDRANSEIEKCIQDLGRDPDWSQRIAKVTRHIDDIIKATSSIVMI